MTLNAKSNGPANPFVYGENIPLNVEATIHSLIRDQAISTPDAVACMWENEELTYRALEARAEILAGHLRSFGIGRGDLVGVCLDKSLNMIPALLSVLKTGAGFVPMARDCPLYRNMTILQESSPKAIITESKLQDSLPLSSYSYVLIDTVDWSQTPDSGPEVEASSEDIMYVTFTSGSTGVPKGVVVKHGSAINFAIWAADRMMLTERDRVLQNGSLTFDVSIKEIFVPLLCGAAVVVPPAGWHQESARLASILDTYQVSHVFIVPSMLHFFLETGAALELKQLKSVHSIGERLTTSLRDAFYKTIDAELYNWYGPTETTVSVLAHLCHPNDAAVVLGQPVYNSRLCVLDERMQPVEAGELGGLYVGGACLAAGYLNRPELTDTCFIPDPFSKDSTELLYKTGDRVRILPNGDFAFFGREDDQVKLRGNRIELGEIESVLSNHPQVHMVAAAVKVASAGDERLVAFVVPRWPKTFGADIQDQIEEWRTVHDRIYKGSVVDDPQFNITGWNRGFDRQPYSNDEMREWVENTVSRIRTLNPRRILEIGCGSGLLLHRLAPDCERYFGTDFSPSVVAELQSKTTQLDHVTISNGLADDFSRFTPGEFDTVVLNSVIQYFPDIAYLQRVLQEAVKLVDDKGVIFVGDVRCLELMEAYYASCIISQGNGDITDREISDLVSIARLQERELAVSPRLFHSLTKRFERVTSVQIHLKKGTYRTEMNCFRYDVVITVGDLPVTGSSRTKRTWDSLDGRLHVLQKLLEKQPQQAFLITGVPNARVIRETTVINRIKDSPINQGAVGVSGKCEPPEEGIDPADVFALAEKLKRPADISFDTSPEAGTMQVCFGNRDPDECNRHHWMPVDSPDGDFSLGNNPLRARFADKIIQELRDQTTDRLPMYMIPSNIIVLEKMPRTPNGKFDRQRLPLPSWGSRNIDFVEPADDIERKVALILANVLGIDRVGQRDNFFDLGGHSLLAIRALNCISAELDIQLDLVRFMENPTVFQLAKQIREDDHDGSITKIPISSKRIDGKPSHISLTQRPLWRIDRIYGADATMNIGYAFELIGALDTDLLETSLIEILHRHEILRSRFVDIEGVPYQIVGEIPADFLESIDMSEKSQADLEAKTNALIRRPFALEHDNLLRTTLLEQTEEKFILVVVMHHLVSDGWSIPIFFNELAELYNAAKQGRKADISERRIQYADFSQWQRDACESGTHNASVAHWKESLDGVSAVLELPTDCRRPKNRSVAGNIYRRPFTRQHTDSIRGCCRQHDCTLYQSLLNVFLVLIYRYTGREDFVIGSPVAGRLHPDVEDLIGLFVNIVPIRADLSQNPSFESLLKRTKRHSLDILAHQGLPFEVLIEELDIDLEPNRTPLVQVQFVLQNTAESKLELNGVSSRLVPVCNGGSVFDLTVEVVEFENGVLELVLEYRTDLFTEKSIVRLADHYFNLLDAMTESPTASVAHAAMLCEDERHGLLGDSDRTSRRYPGDHTLSTLFSRQVSKTPRETAVVIEGESMTYGELENRSNFLANRLISLGIPANGACGLLLERSTDLLVAYLAVFKAGAIGVPIDSGYPPKRIAYVLSNAEVKFVVTHGELDCLIANTASVPICVDRFDWNRLPADQPCPHSRSTPESLACLMYTSGSTGAPKGVQVVQRGLVNCLSWLQSEYPVTGGNRVLMKSSIGFDVSIAELFWPLLNGACVVLARPGGHRDPAYLLQAVREHQITHLVLTPSMLKAILEEPDLSPLESLQVVISTGEAISLNLIQTYFEKLQTPLYNLYGPTEASIWSSFWKSNADAAFVSIGKPISNTQLYILDAKHEPVPVNVAGEIYIGGDGLAKGYKKLPKQTSESFVESPIPGVAGRLYKTGDRARHRENSEIEYLGRIDQQIQVRGVRIEPGELEALLLEHKGVRSAAVAAQRHGPGDVRIHAWVEPVVGKAVVNTKDLRDYLKEHLPNAMLPSVISIVDKMPTTHSGKLDRRSLAKNWAGSTTEDSPPTLKEGSIVFEVAAIFQEVLAEGSVAADDDFFDIGGHSLLAIKISNRIRARFDVDLPLSSVFFNSSPRKLADLVEQLIHVHEA